jgi:hypothetical protein
LFTETFSRLTALEGAIDARALTENLARNGAGNSGRTVVEILNTGLIGALEDTFSITVRRASCPTDVTFADISDALEVRAKSVTRSTGSWSRAGTHADSATSIKAAGRIFSRATIVSDIWAVDVIEFG